MKTEAEGFMMKGEPEKKTCDGEQNTRRESEQARRDGMIKKQADRSEKQK